MEIDVDTSQDHWNKLPEDRAREVPGRFLVCAWDFGVPCPFAREFWEVQGGSSEHD